MTQTGNLYLLYNFNEYDEHWYAVFDLTIPASTRWLSSIDSLLSDPTLHHLDFTPSLDQITLEAERQGYNTLLAPINSIDSILTDFPELVI